MKKGPRFPVKNRRNWREGLADRGQAKSPISPVPATLVLTDKRNTVSTGNQKKGFTLLELLVVLLLISLLAGLVFPRIVTLLPRHKTFLPRAASFIDSTRMLALSRHQPLMLVFTPQSRTITIWALKGEKKEKLPQKLVVPPEIEIKAEGLLSLPEGRWGVIFGPNGASSGGEVEVIDHTTNRRLLCRLARSQFLAEVSPE